MNNPTEPLNIPDKPHGPAAGAENVTLGADTTKHAAPAEPTHPVRAGTMVWGAVVVVIGVLVIITRQSGLQLDTGQASMWLLFGAGLAMVAGGAVNVLRRK